MWDKGRLRNPVGPRPELYEKDNDKIGDSRKSECFVKIDFTPLCFIKDGGFLKKHGSS